MPPSEKSRTFKYMKKYIRESSGETLRPKYITELGNKAGVTCPRDEENKMAAVHFTAPSTWFVNKN